MRQSKRALAGTAIAAGLSVLTMAAAIPGTDGAHFGGQEHPLAPAPVATAAEEDAPTSPGAEQAYLEAQQKYIWTGIADARPLSPFVGIPGELAPTVPYSRSIVESTPGRSETLAGLFYGSEVLEEGILNTTAGDRGNTRPLNPFLIRCNNPDLGLGSSVRYEPLAQGGFSIASAANLPRSSNGVVGGALESVLNAPEARDGMTQAIEAFDENVKPVMQDFGLQLAEAGTGTSMPDGGPDAIADCTSRFVATGASQWGILVPDVVQAGAFGLTAAGFDASTATTSSEVYSGALEVNLADQMAIDAFMSRLRLEKPADKDPTVSYEVHLAGVSGGGEKLVDLGEAGLTVAGTEILPGDLVRDFEAQLAEQAEAVAELATYGITLAAPEVHEDDLGVRVKAPALEFVAHPGSLFTDLDDVEIPEVPLPDDLPVSVPLLNGGGLPARVGPGRIGDQVGVRLGAGEARVSALALPTFTLGPPAGGPLSALPDPVPTGPDPLPTTGTDDAPPAAVGTTNGGGQPAVFSPPVLVPPADTDAAPPAQPQTPVAPPAVAPPVASGPGPASPPATTVGVAAPYAGGGELADAWLWLSLLMLGLVITGPYALRALGRRG